VVVLGQVIPQGHQRRKVKCTAHEQLEHDREALRKTRRGEAPKGLALAQAKVFYAELEHRRVPGPKVQTAVFDFGEVADKLRHHPALGPERRLDPSQELVIGEQILCVHSSVIRPRFSRSWAAKGRAIEAPDGPRGVPALKARPRDCCAH
jgi:hypothetical protein